MEGQRTACQGMARRAETRQGQDKGAAALRGPGVFADQEPPPDPVALAGERRSRRKAPWQVMAFEFQLALRGCRDAFERAADRLQIAADLRHPH